MPTPAPTRVVAVGLLGLASLASAMGIGRFAFTPMLPLMQQAGELTLGDGAWLAAANYLGYLAGALACMRWTPAPAQLARWGLVAIALSTLGMGAVQGVPAWLALRALAGVASAMVLVGVSSWAMPLLAAAGRSDASGWVFAGVGTGIAGAGLVGIAAASRSASPAATWLLLGGCSTLVAAAAWAGLRGGSAARGRVAAAPAAAPRGAIARLVFAYGAFGFGYILPATFLPAIARQALPDPALFGWIWPAVGTAAVITTLLAARRMAQALSLWRGAQAVLAAGVLLPAWNASLGSLLVSAVCVGGTFVVITMVGLHHARRLAGANGPRVLAAMTAAFAFGQLAGPLSLSLLGHTHEGLRIASGAAALMLVAGLVALYRVPNIEEPADEHPHRPPAPVAARADG